MVRPSEIGQWMVWRVGRHRLAWRPIARAPWQAPGYEYNPFGPRTRETFDVVNWVVAVLATIVVWPYRFVTNRWPVVAYVVDPFDGDSRQHRTRPLRRAEANALARQWAEHIKRDGRPPD
jgi:hypothetical protein